MVRRHFVCRVTARPILTLIIASFAIGGFTISGCKDEKKITPPPVVSDYLAQSSAANVLANLSTAYKKQNANEYLKLFASDFTFVFSPADASEPYDPTPVSWGLAEERASTENMFTDSHVEGIQLSFVLGTVQAADSATWGSQTWQMRVDNVNLQVHTRNEQQEPLTYLVPGTTERFYFRVDAGTLASDGRPAWFIFRWEDQPITSGKTEETSWGLVKWNFR